MVEDMFTSRVKDCEIICRRIQNEDPMTKLVRTIKECIKDYNGNETDKLAIKIMDGDREIATLN